MFANGVKLEHNEARLPRDMKQMHEHDFHELYILSAGSRRYFIGHSIFDVAPGNLVFVPKGCLHRTTAPNGKGFERYLLSFCESAHADFIARVGRASFDALLQSGCVQLSPDGVHRVRMLLQQMEREQQAPTPLAHASLSLCLQEILLIAMRDGIPKPTSSSECADRIQVAARYVSEHYEAPITLQEMADLAFMEKTYFCKRFRTLTGFGFHEYLLQTRLRAAERLLLESRYSIEQIAARCGFSCGNYFGDVFRRYRGCAPSAYRARNQGN